MALFDRIEQVAKEFYRIQQNSSRYDGIGQYFIHLDRFKQDSNDLKENLKNSAIKKTILPKLENKQHQQ